MKVRGGSGHDDVIFCSEGGLSRDDAGGGGKNVVCKIPLLARALGLKAATARPSARDDRVSSKNGDF